jgi:hypothetical protein
MKSVLSLDDGRWSVPAEEHTPLPSANLEEELFQLNIKQPSPPPVLAEVQRPISPSRVADPTPGLPTSGTARFQNLHVVSLKCSFSFLKSLYQPSHCSSYIRISSITILVLPSILFLRFLTHVLF